jgi:hypothetical protein
LTDDGDDRDRQHYGSNAVRRKRVTKVAFVQLNLLLEEETRLCGAAGHKEDIAMLNHSANIHTGNGLSNGRSSQPPTKVRQGKMGRLESWLQHGKSERFCEIVIITPERARALLTLNTHNRPIIQAAVEQYAEIMRRGKWRLTIEAIGISKEGVLLNGQHRLEAVCVAGVSAPFTIWFGCDPDEFEIIDQGRKRMAKTLVGLAGYSYPHHRASVARVLLTLEGWSDTTPPAEFVADRVSELGHALDRAVYWGDKMKGVTTPTASVLAYYTIQTAGVSHEDIDDFFGPLVSGIGMSRVISRLRDELKTGDLSKSVHDPFMTIKRSAAIINAWNAHRDRFKNVTFDWPHSTLLPDVVVVARKASKTRR